MLQVEAAGHPGAVGETLPGELRPEVEESPAGVLGEVGLGPVLEAVEVLHPDGSRQVDQAGVHVLQQESEERVSHSEEQNPRGICGLSHSKSLSFNAPAVTQQSCCSKNTI